MEAVTRGGHTFVPQVQIGIAEEVWGSLSVQRKLKADDIRDLAVALAGEWECAPSVLDITSSWDPKTFFGSAVGRTSARGRGFQLLLDRVIHDCY
jgi:hypothetical protein